MVCIYKVKWCNKYKTILCKKNVKCLCKIKTKKFTPHNLKQIEDHKKIIAKPYTPIKREGSSSTKGLLESRVKRFTQKQPDPLELLKGEPKLCKAYIQKLRGRDFDDEEDTSLTASSTHSDWYGGPHSQDHYDL